MSLVSKSQMKTERDDFSGSGVIPVLFDALGVNDDVVTRKPAFGPYQPKLSTQEWWCQVGMIVLFLSTGEYYSVHVSEIASSDDLGTRRMSKKIQATVHVRFCQQPSKIPVQARIFSRDWTQSRMFLQAKFVKARNFYTFE